MEDFLAEVQYLTETGTTENGDTEYDLDPPPVVIPQDEVTMDVAYRVCFALQLDPEKVLFTEEKVELPERPPISHVQTLLEVMVENADDYDVPEMHPTEVKVLMATVTDYFIHASHGKLPVERRS